MDFRNPFMSFASEKTILSSLTKAFPEIPAAELRAAVTKAWEEQAAARKDMQKKGEEIKEKLQDLIAKQKEAKQDNAEAPAEG